MVHLGWGWTWTSQWLFSKISRETFTAGITQAPLSYELQPMFSFGFPLRTLRFLK